jgi:hypothetical protein
MLRGTAADKGRAMASAGMNALRSSSSRILGIALIVTSVLLFAVAFATGFLPFELTSLVSFVLGVALLAVELEPRVRLTLAADGMLGYLLALDGALRALRLTGKATYVPLGDQVKMAMVQDGTGLSVDLPPVGGGLHDEMVEDLGQMNEKGLEFFRLWIPRTLTESLSAAGEVKVSAKGPQVEVSMAKPFVRRLCIDPFVTANVCCRMGCPLAGAVAQSLAVTTGKDVHFEKCEYDPVKQTAKTSLTLA